MGGFPYAYAGYVVHPYVYGKREAEAQFLAAPYAYAAPHAVAATAYGAVHSSLVGVCTDPCRSLRLCCPPCCRCHRLWSRPLQPRRSLHQLCWSPGPLLNSLDEDFHTEPISVLCNLNDNGDAKTNKDPFQFFKKE